MAEREAKVVVSAEHGSGYMQARLNGQLVEVHDIKTGWQAAC